MSTLKARFDHDQAARLLRELCPDAHDLQPLAGGEASRAYAFIADGRPLVLRVNHQFSYERDAWASRKLASTSVPVPCVLQTGEQDALYWAVSERAAGSPLSTLPPEKVASCLPQLVENLIAIHRLPVADSSGYGWIDDAGDAPHATWSAFLMTEGTYGGFVDWDAALSRVDPRHRYLIEESRRTAHALLASGSAERVLNHGDYSLDNVIAADGRITGVVDWSGCLYGDPVRDVAWTDFWTPGAGFAAAYFRSRPTTGGDARLLGYKLLIAAESIGFYTHTEQPEKSAWVAQQVEALLQSARVDRSPEDGAGACDTGRGDTH